MLGPRSYCITNLAQGGSVVQVADHALGVRGPLATSFRSHARRILVSAELSTESTELVTAPQARSGLVSHQF